MADMTKDLADQVHRLRIIFASVEMPFVTRPGARDDETDAIEQIAGVRFDPDLRSLWRFSNGSTGHGRWFSVDSDERTGCDFAPLAKCLESWRVFESYNTGDAPGKDVNCAPWDPRIKPGSLYRQTWFPFAGFNGFSTAVHFDSDPTLAGRPGQIVVYQHDPEAAYFVADSFLDFFRKSNDWIAANLTAHFFGSDEYKRICHMGGTFELEHQLAAGLDVTRKNRRGKDLRAMAIAAKRDDLVRFLDDIRRPDLQR